MGSPTYSAPPEYPEINQSSPFYQTLAGLVMWTKADGTPRGIVHNGMGHACAGYQPITSAFMPGGGCSMGSEGVIVPNSFPFNPPADGLFANDYSYATSGTNRPRQWLYEGNQPQSGIDGCTIFGIFNFQGGSFGDAGFYYPIFGLNKASYAGSGNSTFPDCLLLYPVNNSLYLAHASMISIANGYIYGSQFPVIPGHWYAVALARNDQAGTGINGSFSLAYFMRMYLYDLTTGTRIGPYGTGQSQTFTRGGTNYTDHVPTGNTLGQYYNGTTGAEIAFPLTAAPPGTDGTLGASLLVKMIGVDSVCWDDSGFAYAIPAGFSGVDQFSYWINNIYEMVGSTYATGTNTGGMIFSDALLGTNAKLVGGYANATTGFAAINGAYSNTNCVFYGDAVLSDVNNKTIQITCSRPQASPSLPSSLTYSLYKYAITNCPVGFIASITNANPGVVHILQPSAANPNPYTNGQQVTIWNVGGMTQVNGNTYTVANANLGAATFQLSGTDTTSYGTATANTGFILPANLGTAVATSTDGNFVYTPPDTNVYMYLITATDGTNFYFWNPVTASLNLYPDQNFAVVGNSVVGQAGVSPVYWLHLVAGFRTRVNILDFGVGGTGSAVATPAIEAVMKATFGGTATNGDTVAITFNNSGLTGGTQTVSITVSTSETTTQMATAMAAAINANSNLVANGLGATSSGAVVTINALSSSNLTNWTYAITGSVTETLLLTTPVGVPAWSTITNNWYGWYSEIMATDVANRGQPYIFLGQMIGNDAGLVNQTTYQADLTAIQNALLALTTTYLGPTTGSLTHGQTINVVSKVIWLAAPWQRGAHYFSAMAQFPAYNGFQQNISNGTTVLTLGSGAYNYTSNFPDDVSGGHPGPNGARMEMMALINDLYQTTINNIIVQGGSGSGPAIGFPSASIGG